MEIEPQKSPVDITSMDPVNRLAEEIGRFIEYWGFKRIHGKIWTHIYLSPIPLNATALIERLKISKALVSISLKDLLNYKVIIEAGKGADATRGYVANPNVTEVILSVLRNREQNMLRRIYDEFMNLKSEHQQSSLPNLSNERINQLEKMIATANDTLKTFLNHGPVEFPDL